MKLIRLHELHVGHCCSWETKGFRILLCLTTYLPSFSKAVFQTIGIVLSTMLLMWAGVSVAQAQSHQTLVQTKAVFQFINVQDCGYCASHGPGPIEGDLASAWSDAQTTNYSGPSGTWTATNLHPNPSISPTQLNGNYAVQYFDEVICSNGCTTAVESGTINSSVACPITSPGAGNYNSPAVNQLRLCPITESDIQPIPCKTESCQGNPIYAATGQKYQVETDYSGGTGLEFTRTYRSSRGYFTSILTQTFIDGSTPAGTVSAGCYPSTWTYGNGGGVYCFPYTSANNGSPIYALQTSDGRSIGFTGPTSAVTPNADINERVTLLTSGPAKWQIRRNDDSIELYDSSGLLLQKTMRGGQAFTYTYSTTSTPATIASRPGLLIKQSDAFGHALSWTYNASGLMSSMTDPAGGVFNYAYTSGTLTSVTYPDLTKKTYWWNEAAYTAGVSQPFALTGITDENNVRFATFQYDSSGLATNTQHAGGVESYSFNYVSPNNQTIITDL